MQETSVLNILPQSDSELNLFIKGVEGGVLTGVISKTELTNHITNLSCLLAEMVKIYRNANTKSKTQ